MRKQKAEKQILRDADKLISMKDNIEAASWDRVVDIAQEIPNARSTALREELSRELLSIAKANISVLDRFGISTEAETGLTTPAGIAINADDHYLSPADVDQPMNGTSYGHDGLPAVENEPIHDENLFESESFAPKSKDRAQFRDYYDPFEGSTFFTDEIEEEKPSRKVMVIPRAQSTYAATSVDTAKKFTAAESKRTVVDAVASESFKEEATAIEVDMAASTTSSTTEDLEAATLFVAKHSKERKYAGPEQPESELATENAFTLEVSSEQAHVPEPDSTIEDSDTDIVTVAGESSEIAADADNADTDAETGTDVAFDPHDFNGALLAAMQKARGSSSRVPAKRVERERRQSAVDGSSSVQNKENNLTCIYKSRDSGFSLFEDSEGHLVAVDPSRVQQ